MGITRTLLLQFTTHFQYKHKLAKLLSKGKSFFLNLNDHQISKIEYFIQSKIFVKIEFLLECDTSLFSDGYLFFIYFRYQSWQKYLIPIRLIFPGWQYQA